MRSTAADPEKKRLYVYIYIFIAIAASLGNTQCGQSRQHLLGHVDLYINVRVSNGHPKALDTILRVRFTVIYHRHLPSALHTWNTRASTASSGVINSGVVGDAPEGGKQQSEDTTVAA